MPTVHGIDSLGNQYPLLVDASGRVIVVGSGASGEMTVTQTTPASLTPGVYGWDGTTWRKVIVDTTGRVIISRTERVLVDPGGADKIFAYESVRQEALSNLDLAAGTNTLLGALVPAGKMLYVATASLNYAGTVTGVLLDVAINDGLSQIVVYRTAVAVSGTLFCTYPCCYIPAGGRVVFLTYNATLHDDFYAQYNGYLMDAT
jgi:hypothetical protein